MRSPAVKETIPLETIRFEPVLCEPLPSGFVQPETRLHGVPGEWRLFAVGVP